MKKYLLSNYHKSVSQLQFVLFVTHFVDELEILIGGHKVMGSIDDVIGTLELRDCSDLVVAQS